MWERISNKKRTFTTLQKLVSGITCDAYNANSCTNSLTFDDDNDSDDARGRDLSLVVVLARDGEE